MTYDDDCFISSDISMIKAREISRVDEDESSILHVIKEMDPSPRQGKSMRLVEAHPVHSRGSRGYDEKHMTPLR